MFGPVDVRAVSALVDREDYAKALQVIDAST
jgi:hypothetical protein